MTYANSSSPLLPRTRNAPTPRHFDETIEESNGLTFANYLRNATVQRMKRLPRPTYEERLIEIIRENASFKRELSFFREAYSAMERLQADIHDIAQRLILKHCLSIHGEPDEQDRWLEAITEINEVLKFSKVRLERACDEWVELSAGLPLYDESVVVCKNSLSKWLDIGTTKMLHKKSNEERKILRDMCRNQLSKFIKTKINVDIDPEQVRLITSSSDPYSWKYTPERQHLFVKQISKHNASAYREITRELGKSIEVLRQQTCPGTSITASESLIERVRSLEKENQELLEHRNTSVCHISSLHTEVSNLQATLQHKNVQLRQVQDMNQRKDDERAQMMSEVREWWDRYYVLQQKLMRAVNDDLIDLMSSRAPKKACLLENE